MVRLNKVILAGNLTRDPTLRKIPNGTPVVDFGLAVDDGFNGKNGNSEASTCFVDVVAWDKQAVVCEEYLRKGRPVLIEGRLHYSQWKDKNGENRNKLKVTAERIQFVGSPENKGRSKPERRSSDEDRD